MRPATAPIATMLQGVCLDGLNPAGAPSASAYPFDVARVQARPGQRWASYAAQLRAAGKRVAVVLDTLAIPDGADVSTSALGYARQFRADWWILHNEMDQVGDASGTEDAAAFGRFWTAAGRGIHAVDPTAQLVVGGMASGIPARAVPFVLAATLSGIRPAAMDVHLYPDDPAYDPRPLLAAYAAACGLPLFCLEWHLPEGGDVARFARLLAGAGVQVSCYFCWADGMVRDLGLFDGDGTARADYQALLEAAREGLSMASETEKFIEEHAEAVGKTYVQGVTTTEAGPFPAGTRYTWTDGGLLVEIPGVLGCYALTDAAALEKFRSIPA